MNGPLMTFHDTTAEIGVSFRTHGRTHGHTDGRTNVEVESYWGVRVTKNAYFSLLIHAKQLLSVTFCDKTAGIRPSFRTHTRRRRYRCTHRWTDRRGS